MNDLPPGSRSPPDAALAPKALHADLDARILAAEHAVIERDRRVRDGAGRLVAKLRDSTRHSARIAAFAAAGSFGLGWLIARGTLGSRRRPPTGKERAIQRHMPALADAPWAGIVPLLWPLLPLAVRSRISPGLASFVTGLGLPLVARQLGRRKARAELRQEQQQRRAEARGGNGAATLH